MQHDCTLRAVLHLCSASTCPASSSASGGAYCGAAACWPRCAAASTCTQLLYGPLVLPAWDDITSALHAALHLCPGLSYMLSATGSACCGAAACWPLCAAASTHTKRHQRPCDWFVWMSSDVHPTLRCIFQIYDMSAAGGACCGAAAAAQWAHRRAVRWRQPVCSACGSSGSRCH